MPMLDFILMNTSVWDTKFSVTPAKEEQPAEETTETEEQNTSTEADEQIAETDNKQEVKSEEGTKDDTEETSNEATENNETQNKTNSDGLSAEEMSEIDAIFKRFEDPNASFEIDPATIEKLENDQKARTELVDKLLAALK